jgi:hypothetical protein
LFSFFIIFILFPFRPSVAWLQAAGALAFERWHFPPLGSHALMASFILQF